jgi:hypothetical protein
MALRDSSLRPNEIQIFNRSIVVRPVNQIRKSWPDPAERGSRRWSEAESINERLDPRRNLRVLHDNGSNLSPGCTVVGRWVE